jgi:hypothetical protein
MLVPLPTDSRCGRGPRSKPPSSSGLGLRPFKAAARVRIPLGVRFRCSTTEQQGPVAQLVSASPCHGEGRGFESRLGRFTPGAQHRARPGSSVGTSDRLKSGRSAVRPRPWPPRVASAARLTSFRLRPSRWWRVFWGRSPQTPPGGASPPGPPTAGQLGCFGFRLVARRVPVGLLAALRRGSPASPTSLHGESDVSVRAVPRRSGLVLGGRALRRRQLRYRGDRCG